MYGFSAFNLEASDGTDCTTDYVEIREDDHYGNVLGRFCGQELPTNHTRGRALWVKFVSDGQNAGTGFTAQFSTGKLWFREHRVQYETTYALLYAFLPPGIFYVLKSLGVFEQAVHI